MNSYQTALKGQTEAYEAAQAALLAQQTEMDRLYAALAREIEQRAAQQRLDAAQRAAQQAESAYHDMLLSQNPLGMHRQRPTIPLARTVPLFAIPSRRPRPPSRLRKAAAWHRQRSIRPSRTPKRPRRWKSRWTLMPRRAWRC